MSPGFELGPFLVTAALVAVCLILLIWDAKK
jgi:hypothetical protein